MWLILSHPHVANRDCGHCQLWQYIDDPKDPKRGQIADWRGKPAQRKGNTPCRLAIGCPKGTPENQKQLTRENLQAYAHWLECNAVGFSLVEQADPIVRRNARIIKKQRDDFDWLQRRKDLFELAELLQRLP